ncbi:MAG: phosphatidate cytidylyltransferase [Moraxellaceae bacterium]|nr:phosphatidate cytidylyltransferase [Moraxellaceae bacterium]MDZ4385799.1 phosphatidate cytidylyltransferase [Moraxellaceae bacterium]
MLKERVITALILLPLVLWCVFGGQPHAFSLFAAALVLMAAWEWTALLRWSSMAIRMGFVAVVAACLWLLQDVALAQLGPWLVVVAGFWLLLLFWVSRYPDLADSWDTPWLMSIIGLLLLVPTWAGLVQLHTISPWWLMFMLLLVWGADTGAYFAGRRFGKVKLAVHVSPAKSREGVYGGLVLTSVIAVAVALSLAMPVIKMAVFLLISMVSVLASVLGDLFESMVKRRAGIKDSGKIFPGHGGALDRIDSITAAAPVFMAGWWLAGGF